MKISKWAYSIEEGPIEPVYVYEAPVRFWHWAQCAAFFMLVISSCCTWFAACCSPF